MLFNSLEFLIFFPVVAAVFFLLPHRFRGLFLLLASYYFYMCWRVEYVLVIIFLTCIDYWAGIKMADCKDSNLRRTFLIVSLGANLGLLFSFKYLSFLNESVRSVLQLLGVSYDVPYLNILLPMGISFHTFQTMAYAIDVYRGNQKAERSFLKFALYVAFFPQLVAGPIERAGNLIPQFYKKHVLSSSNLVYGLRRIVWGFFKKVVIADRLALLVNRIFNDPQQYQGIPLIIAAVFFAFQLYCDFSAYTDIAIGSARVMGFKLKENFALPFSATSVRDFWNRWHISLSSWVKDYLYTPLFLALRGLSPHYRLYASLMISMVLFGLWHGAGWNFIFFGFYWGVWLVLYAMLSPIFRHWLQFKNPALEGAWFGARVIFTFIIMAVGMIFFRANSLNDAFYIITHLLDFSTTSQWLEAMSIKNNTVIVMGLSKLDIVFSFGLILFSQAFYWFQLRKGLFAVKPAVMRFTFYYILIVLMIFLGKFDKSPFIYFQF